ANRVAVQRSLHRDAIEEVQDAGAETQFYCNRSSSCWLVGPREAHIDLRTYGAQGAHVGPELRRWLGISVNGIFRVDDLGEYQDQGLLLRAVGFAVGVHPLELLGLQRQQPPQESQQKQARFWEETN